MNTTTWTPNLDTDTDPYADVYGRQAVYTSDWDGTRSVGLVDGTRGIYALIRFEDGTFARANETLELVVN